MNLPIESGCRRFLLGIASEEDEKRAEEAILTGHVDAADIAILEDGLIDDYMFGDLSPDEEQAFLSHFLSTDEHRRKLAFARALMHYARKRPSAAPETGKDSLHAQRPRITLPWPRVAVAALAASILLVCLIGFEQAALRRQTKLSQNAQNEIARLQGALAERDSRSRVDLVQEAYFVLPPRTRDALHPFVLHITPQARLVWINLNLISPTAGTYTVELYKDGRPLWTQELDVSQSDRRTIVLPASLLSSGSYLIQFKNSNPLVQQTFRVERN